MKRTNTKETRFARSQKLQEGIRKHLGKSKTVSFGGVTYTPAVLLSTLQAAIDAGDDTDAKKAVYHAAVEAEQVARTKSQAVDVGLPAYLYLTYGNSNEILADFGLAPRRRHTPTVATKAEAAIKATKTRKGKAGSASAGASASTQDAAGAGTTAATPSGMKPAVATN